MKYKLFFILLMQSIMLVGCGGTQPLVLQNLDFRREPSFAVQMQQIQGEKALLTYQEQGEKKSGDLLDSLMIESVSSDLAISAYIQQALNKLKLHGYHISDEKSQKKVLIHQDIRYDALLKTYTILKTESERLHIAQYIIDLKGKYLLISYATDTLKHRKTFIKNLTSITF